LQTKARGVALSGAFSAAAQKTDSNRQQAALPSRQINADSLESPLQSADTYDLGHPVRREAASGAEGNRRLPRRKFEGFPTPRFSTKAKSAISDVAQGSPARISCVDEWT